MNAVSKLLFLSAVLAGCDDGDVPPEPPPCDTSVVGNICTVAGEVGKSGYSGDDGPALEARLSLPQDTLVIDGQLYILDWNNHRIRKVVDGTMYHVAGRGELGGTLDDPANDDFNHPTGMLKHPTQNRIVVAAWHNSKIRELDLDTGMIHDTCGDGRRAYFGDEGPAKTATLDLPASIAFSPAGELVIMDQANQVLRSIDAAGNIHRLAGKCVIDAAPPLGAGKCAEGVEPVACPGGSGKFTCGPVMATCGAPCTPSYGGDGEHALEMRMAQPFGQSADPAGRIAYDAAGNLYFADTANAIIRKIDTAGIVTRVAGVAPIDGVAQAGYSGDGGPATSAQLDNPVDLAIDTDGTIYFTDVYNHCVRKVAPDGVISTVAGQCGNSDFSGDGGPANQATLKRPYGIDLHEGTLYISDTGNQVIRAVKLR